MKALKSERAKILLADPSARGQLRIYLAGRSGSAVQQHANVNMIELRSDAGKIVRLRPVVVPKAA
jgi:hypothetical protein